jgi:GIY-YIG catalytic domain.
MNIGSRTVTIFFKDGVENGRLKCQLSNWDGVAYKIPRTFLSNCKNDNEFNKTGIYMLFGKDIDSDIDKIYIGETENLYTRLTEHISEDFWNDIVMFTSKGVPLNKAHVKNMESKLYKMAKSAERFRVENNNEPTRSNLSEEDEDRIDGFIEKIKLIVKPLGYNLFEPIVYNIENVNDTTPEKLICQGRDYMAYGYRVDNGFTVLKGSTIKKEIGANVPRDFERIRRLRNMGNSNIQDGVLLVDDVLLSSPSAAADFVAGSICNGLEYWKNESGKTLKQIEEEAATI